MNDERYSDDMAWAALWATATEVAPQLGEEFLRKVYEIQKRHQFSRDRSESLRLLENLVESELGGGE
jgi:hypothetical protein